MQNIKENTLKLKGALKQMSWIEEHVNTVTCGDSIEIVKQIEDKSISLVLTDPPYGIDFNYESYSDTKENWKELILQFIPESKRIGKMTIMQSCGIPELKFIYDNFPPDWMICWYKGSPARRSFIGFNQYELLLVYGKNDGMQMPDYFAATPANDHKGMYGHPCPKPLAWARWLISRATKEGMTMLDPFCGSGTVCVAANQLNRNFIGIDISEKYCEIARKRIQDAQRQERIKFE